MGPLLFCATLVDLGEYVCILSPMKPINPSFVGFNAPVEDPVVSQYKAGVAARAKAAGSAQKVPIPNIKEASREYDPKKDGVMTLSQIAQGQDNIMDLSAPKKTGLSEDTLQGLAALKQAQVSGELKEAPIAAPTEQPRQKLTEDEKQKFRETSDLDLDLALTRLRSDILNNEAERNAVKERVKPMDLADGLMNGEFRQHVPIVPDKFEVVFRAISPMETEEIRKRVLTDVLGSEHLEGLAADKFGFMQVVAAVHSINGKELPSHIKATGGVKGFDWETFDRKFATLSAYPSAFAHSLGTHAYWFDLRVRELFTSVNLKNG